MDAVCEGLVASGAAGLDTHRASRALGEQRSEVGTHLSEARSDLAIVLGLARVRSRQRLELLDALTVGWAEHGVECLPGLAVLDERMEMATLAYLTTRLRELYREATLTGTDVSVHYVLIVVETEHTGDRLVAETRLTTLHSALEYAFVGGESIVAVTPRRAVALAARDEPRLSDSLARLRSELKTAVYEGRLPSAHCRRLPLPPDAADLCAVVTAVRC